MAADSERSRIGAAVDNRRSAMHKSMDSTLTVCAIRPPANILPTDLRTALTNVGLLYVMALMMAGYPQPLFLLLRSLQIDLLSVILPDSYYS